MQQRIFDHLRSGERLLADGSPFQEMLQRAANRMLEAEVDHHLDTERLGDHRRGVGRHRGLALAPPAASVRGGVFGCSILPSALHHLNTSRRLSRSTGFMRAAFPPELSTAKFLMTGSRGCRSFARQGTAARVGTSLSCLRRSHSRYPP